ncbi:MAG: LysR family transcriptional regulator [Magnetococcales bacterium]|nr:LysR family transcriptional regulator [Magnetococcales bacterium]
MMILPTLRQFQYLVTVVETCHFGQAAKRCHASQSSLSTGIQELENLIGAPLLERTKRSVKPTLLGEEIAKRAREILTMSQEIMVLSKIAAQPLSSALRLGTIPTIGPFLLPTILPAVRKQFPALQLLLREDQSATLVKAVDDGSLDVAILAFPYEVGRLNQALIYEENFLVGMPTDHPLTANDVISTGDFEPEELLLLEEGHCLRDHVLAVCHLEQLQKDRTFQGTSLYTLIQMVAGKQGITFIPEMALNTTAIPKTEITLRPFAEPGPHRKIGLIWRKSFPRQDEIETLLLFLRTVMTTSRKQP